MMDSTTTTNPQSVVSTLPVAFDRSIFMMDETTTTTAHSVVSALPTNVNNDVVTVDFSGERGLLDGDNTYFDGGSTTRMLVSADGTKIYANAVGDPSKQAVVFIHGFVWSFMAFDDIFEDVEWRKRFYLVRYDVRGHGRSGKPLDRDESWEWERFAEDFDTVVEAFEVVRPFVVGWSLGASHLLDILTLHPVDYIAGIINIAGATFLDDTQLERLATPEGREYIGRVTVAPTVEDFQSGVQDFIDACCRTLPYEVRERCLGQIMTQPRSCMVRSLTRKQRVETFDAVGKTMLPCLVIFGDRDELIVVDELLRQYGKWRNLTVEVVEGGSHVPWTKTQGDAAADFGEKTLGWIDSVMRSWN